MNWFRQLRLLCSAWLFFSLAAATLAQGPSILSRDQAGPLLPATVFYAGQVAPVQTRNSAGIKLPDGKLLLLATLVDTSGYSSAIQGTYQGYLLVSEPLRVGDRTLSPGAYGFGFVSGNRMVALDLGAHQLFSVPTTPDTALTRPSPLQILPGPDPTHFRLYLGRSFVVLTPASSNP